ncbi:hypothetical protein [Methanonatronarchaeum sp. AMET-Sl]|uniref:hypothetical protein n=1 Tax=Methanonatronarchaeum sp. AMET-Sl TaxID=3037654 RepID=UPI00244E3E8B|nr:hypothetical protein [Methanonatronarchaeum sp. AMET-Sl]WGI17655.1 hypothetical protein QEN48_01205 [Methanonatronarchaeum sp. AMET-Sl]
MKIRRLYQKALLKYKQDGVIPLLDLVFRYSLNRFKIFYRQKKYNYQYGRASPDPLKLIKIPTSEAKYLLVPNASSKYLLDGYKILGGEWDKNYSNKKFYYIANHKKSPENFKGFNLINFKNFVFYTSIKIILRKIYPGKKQSSTTML